MEMDEKKIALAAAVFAVAGIALLFFLSETPRESSVAEALVAPASSYLSISGIARNVTADKFYLCLVFEENGRFLAHTQWGRRGADGYRGVWVSLLDHSANSKAIDFITGLPSQ